MQENPYVKINLSVNYNSEAVRIAVDAKRFFYNGAGLGKYSRVLLEALCNNWQDAEFKLLTPKSKRLIHYQNPLPDNVEKISLGSGILGTMTRSLGITAVLHKLKAQIYLGLSNELPADIKKSKAKSILVVHDVLFMDYPEEYKAIDRMIYKFKLKTSLEQADRIIAVSNYTKKRLLHHFSISEQQIQVIPPPVDIKFWQNIDNSISTASIMPETGSYLLSVSTWGERKNLHRIIAALDLLKWPVSLVVTGRNKELLNNLNETRKIICMSHLSEQELRWVYQHSLGLLYPSIDEGFGLPLIEAMACGIPVLTSNRGVMPETTAHEAILVDPFDINALAEGIQHLLIFQGKSSYSQDHLRQFDPNVVAIKFMNLMSGLIND